MALLLTADQIAAIKAGQKTRQVWYVTVPWDAAHSAFTPETRFHDEAITSPAPLLNVLKAGRRNYYAVNASPMDGRKLQRARHAFVVRNDTGKWYPGTTTSWWTNASTGYQAVPQECRIRHRVYVMLLTGAWSEITCLDFTGQVVKCDPTDLRRADGTIAGDTATIQMDAMGAWETLAHIYTRDDGASTWLDVQFDEVYGVP